MDDIIDKPKIFTDKKEDLKDKDNEDKDDIEAPPSVAQSQSSISSQLNNDNNQYNDQYYYTPEYINMGLDNIEDPNQQKLHSSPMNNNNPPNAYFNNIQQKDGINQEYNGPKDYKGYPHFPHYPHFHGFPHHFPPHLSRDNHGPMEQFPPEVYKDFPHWPHFHGFGPHFFHGPHFWPHGFHDQHFGPHGPHNWDEFHHHGPHFHHHHGHGHHFHHHGPHFEGTPNNLDTNNIQKEDIK